MPRIILLSVFALFVTLPASAQQNAEPCGPAADLSEDFSKNVDSDSRCFELRMYTAEPAVDGEAVLITCTSGSVRRRWPFLRSMVPRLSLYGSVWTTEHAGLDAGLSRSGPPPGSLGSVCRGSRLACAAEKYAVPLSAEAYMMSATDYSKLK